MNFWGRKIWFTKSEIHKIRTNQKIQKKLRQNTPEPKAAATVLSNSENFHSIIGKNIIKNCMALKKNKTSIPSAFFEFSEHACAQFSLIDTTPITEKAPKSKDNQVHYFRVEQWPKDRATTFFLGDEVGCCLATNSSQFQAMVQRRMDDAMLFHVATDITTGKPVALVWLYLVETSDKQIVLMANFFEVKLRKLLRTNLEIVTDI